MTKCLLVEMDYKALEAQLVGFFAKDPDYIRAAKLGVHSILMSEVMGHPIDLRKSDADIKPVLKAFKKTDLVLYDACKHVVHMSNYLGTPRRIRLEFPDYFPSVADARQKQDIYFSTIAKKVKQWQQRTLNEAFQNHYLETPHGYRHYFWDVLHYEGKQLVWGTDAKRAVAFKPQATGAGVLSEALLRISRYPELFAMIRWIIHDSLVVEIPVNNMFHRNVQMFRTLMEAPNPELDGLSIEVEVQVGKNWGEMSDYMEDYDYEQMAA